MTPIDRLQIRTGSDDTDLLDDLLESAKSVILQRRYPYGDYPTELETRYEDLQLRIALYMYQKQGADFEKSHSEGGVNRSWGTGGVPESLLQEITPKVGVVG